MREIVAAGDGAIAEISGKRHAVREQGNCFGSGKHAGRSFHFVFAIERSGLRAIRGKW